MHRVVGALVGALAALAAGSATLAYAPGAAGQPGGLGVQVAEAGAVALGRAAGVLQLEPAPGGAGGHGDGLEAGWNASLCRWLVSVPTGPSGRLPSGWGGARCF
jgi:hypothetical protein